MMVTNFKCHYVENVPKTKMCHCMEAKIWPSYTALIILILLFLLSEADPIYYQKAYLIKPKKHRCTSTTMHNFFQISEPSCTTSMFGKLAVHRCTCSVPISLFLVHFSFFLRFFLSQLLHFI